MGSGLACSTVQAMLIFPFLTIRFLSLEVADREPQARHTFRGLAMPVV